MAQYIDKDVLVTEIEKRIEFHGALNAYSRLDECYEILSILDTLEVKGVEKEIPTWVREVQREDPFDDRWFIGMDDCLHRKGYKIKICDLWNLPKELFNT